MKRAPLLLLGAILLGVLLWCRREAEGGEETGRVPPGQSAAAERGEPGVFSVGAPLAAGGWEGVAEERSTRRELAGAGAANLELDVRRADGAPAAGAWVVTFRDGEVLSRATTDLRGHATVFAPAAEGEVAIHAPEGPVLRAPLPSLATRLTLTLPPGTEVAGRMTVDGMAPGEEVALRLQVTASTRTPDSLPNSVRKALHIEPQTVRTTHTARDGTFRFAGLPEEWRAGELQTPAAFHVFTGKERRGGWPVSQRATHVPRPVHDLHLECGRAVRIRGRIVHSDSGKSIGGAWATLEGDVPGETCATSRTRVTGEDGRFAYDLQPPILADRLVLTVASGEGAGEVEIPIDRPLPDEEGIWELGDVPLAPFTLRNFLVRTSGGEAIAGAVVQVPQDGKPHGQRASAETDGEGRTAMEVERRLDHLLVHAPHYRPVRVALGADPPDPIVVPMEAAAELLVVVTCDDGPLPRGVQVAISCARPLFPASDTWHPGPGGRTTWAGGGIGVTVHSESERGTLRLAVDDEGRLGLSAVRTGEPLGIRVFGPCGFTVFEEEIAALHEGEKRVVPVEVGGRVRWLRGLVLDPDGRGVPGAAVSLREEDGGMGFVARTLSNGSFHLRGFLPAALSFAVTADTGGLSPLREDDVPLPPYGKVLVLHMLQGFAVCVAVQDHAGRPVEGGRLEARTPGTAPLEATRIGPGLHTFAGLPPGRVCLALRLGGRAFTLDHDTADPEARFEVPPSSPVVVTVESLPPREEAGRYYVVLTGRKDVHGTLFEEIEADREGPWTVRFPGVFAGEYALHLNRRVGATWSNDRLAAPIPLAVPDNGDEVRATLRF